MDNYNTILQMAMNIIAPGSRFTVSSIIEESIKDVLINKYGEKWEERRQLFIDSYEKLRSNFNINTYQNDIPYFYSMYYMPINIPKVQTTILDLMIRKKIPKNIKILDIGSSVGTTVFAIIDLVVLLDNLCNLIETQSIFETIKMDFVEGSSDNIKVFNENVSYFESRMDKFMEKNKFQISQPINQDITKHWDIEGQYDIIIFSNILNELTYSNRKKVILQSIKYLENSGNIIVIEPASYTKAESLNKLKYDIVSESNLNCIAPCGVSESCKNCWIFRSENSVRNGLIKYVDEIYNGYIKNDEFFNERLKWNYVIFDKDKVDYKISNLENIDCNKYIKCNFYIVSNYNNNQYKICDGNCGRDGFDLDTCGYPVNKLNFGDVVNAENVVIKSIGNKKTIKLNQESIIKSAFKLEKSQKLKIKNVEEKSLMYILKRQWGFSGFREGQFEIIRKALLDTDAIGILPTGAGKSLCFQLPAILKTGASIVISPLKSLMKDQIDNLYKIGFEYVDYIDSSRNALQKKEILNRFKEGFLKLLYVSPERLQIKDFQNELISLMKDMSIDYFIIDEAHCASEWGHDFRPSYLKVVDVKNKINNPTLIALTATASPRVRKDIADIFEIEDTNILLPKTFDRPEISLQVKTVEIDEEKDEVLLEAINEDIPTILKGQNISDIHKKGSGLVFAIYGNASGKNTRKFGTQYISSMINEECGIESYDYNSKLSDEVRVQRQNDYKNDKIPLLVSTKGFGMGIDKPNIDYIIHMCYSNSLEAYYQEVGRAGRDKEHAHAIVIAKKRHPDCLRSSKSLGNNEPLCVDRWICSFTGGCKCDYGMQARFINQQYPKVEIMTKDIERFIEMIDSKSYNRKEFMIDANGDDETAKYQKYLFYLQKYGLVKDYIVDAYTGSGMRIKVILNRYLREINKIKIIDLIVNRLQEFKKQKYGMLESMWEYVDSKICRRQFIMNYFGDNVNYGQGCRFCDIEGISEEKAIQVTPDARIDRIYKALNEILKENEFLYNKVFELKEKAYKENIEENIKIRSMKLLEDYPNNLAALYLTGFISIKKHVNEAYARNQIYRCIEELYNKNRVKEVTEVLYELSNIDESLAFDIAAKFKVIVENIDLLENLMIKIKDKNKIEYLYKSYWINKVNKINKSLERGIL